MSQLVKTPPRCLEALCVKKTNKNTTAKTLKENTNKTQTQHKTHKKQKTM